MDSRDFALCDDNTYALQAGKSFVNGKAAVEMYQMRGDRVRQEDRLLAFNARHYCKYNDDQRSKIQYKIFEDLHAVHGWPETIGTTFCGVITWMEESKTEGRICYVEYTNLGDSHCHVIRVNNASNSVSCERLNKIHCITEPEEKKRVLDLGGKINSKGYIVSFNEYNISVTGAIGDMCHQHVLHRIPDVKTIKFLLNKNEDIFVLVCSDGMDSLQDSQIAEFFSRNLYRPPEDLIVDLVKEAKAKDNNSAGLIVPSADPTGCVVLDGHGAEFEIGDLAARGVAYHYVPYLFYYMSENLGFKKALLEQGFKQWTEVRTNYLNTDHIDFNHVYIVSCYVLDCLKKLIKNYPAIFSEPFNEILINKIKEFKPYEIESILTELTIGLVMSQASPVRSQMDLLWNILSHYLTVPMAVKQITLLFRRISDLSMENARSDIILLFRVTAFWIEQISNISPHEKVEITSDQINRVIQLLLELETKELPNDKSIIENFLLKEEMLRQSNNFMLCNDDAQVFLAHKELANRDSYVSMSERMGAEKKSQENRIAAFTLHRYQNFSASIRDDIQKRIHEDMQKYYGWCCADYTFCSAVTWLEEKGACQVDCTYLGSVDCRVIVRAAKSNEIECRSVRPEKKESSSGLVTHSVCYPVKDAKVMYVVNSIGLGSISNDEMSELFLKWQDLSTDKISEELAAEALKRGSTQAISVGIIAAPSFVPTGCIIARGPDSDFAARAVANLYYFHLLHQTHTNGIRDTVLKLSLQEFVKALEHRNNNDPLDLNKILFFCCFIFFCFKEQKLPYEFFSTVHFVINFNDIHFTKKSIHALAECYAENPLAQTAPHIKESIKILWFIFIRKKPQSGSDCINELIHKVSKLDLQRIPVIVNYFKLIAGHSPENFVGSGVSLQELQGIEERLSAACSHLEKNEFDQLNKFLRSARQIRPALEEEAKKILLQLRDEMEQYKHQDTYPSGINEQRLLIDKMKFLNDAKKSWRKILLLVVDVAKRKCDQGRENKASPGLFAPSEKYIKYLKKCNSTQSLKKWFVESQPHSQSRMIK